MPNGHVEQIAIVIVYGDVGHSPRMINHCSELLSAGYYVKLIGYLHSEIPIKREDNSFESLILPEYKIHSKIIPNCIQRCLNIFIKLVLGFSSILFWLLTGRLGSKCELVLVQSPPVLPTLPVGWLLTKLLRAKFIADWHNVAYTLLAQSLPLPAIISIAKAIELWSTRLPDVNIVVSEAQRNWMEINAGNISHVLYDRPVTDKFKVLDDTDRKTCRTKLRQRLGWARDKDVPILVTSTSWTADEDFSILIEALPLITHRVQLLITGKGPLKSLFESKILSLALDKIQFATLWLTSDEYPKMLASCDLGICLHTSSSGVDLPMKVIDMISAGLPVVAYDYGAIREVMVDDNSRFLFHDGKDLARLINDYLSKKLRWPRLEIENWHEQWSRVFGSVLNSSKPDEETTKSK